MSGFGMFHLSTLQRHISLNIPDLQLILKLNSHSKSNLALIIFNAIRIVQPMQKMRKEKGDFLFNM